MKENFEKFGITEEEFKKSKDILPTFDLGKLDEYSKVVLKFLDSEPKMVRHKNKFKSKPEEPEEIETPVINVHVDTIFRPDGKNFLEIPINEKYTLWLSAKSLSLGIYKIYNESKDLKDIVATVSITKAEFKNFGENRCYNVTKSETI